MPKRLVVSLIVAVLLAACQPAPEERYARAENYFAEADYRAAVLELKNALQDRPDYAAARYLLGRASYQLADFAIAQKELERTLSLGLIGAEVWADLGKSLLAQGDAAGALERVVPNLPAETATPEQLVLLGDIYLALGNRDEAAQHYARALNLAPATPGALIGQAVIARQNNDLERAEQLLADAIALNPDSDLVWRAKGNFLRANRDHASAADAYDRSIALETGATPLAERLMVRVNRVSALLDGRELEEAQEKFLQLKAVFPSHPVIRFLSGRIAYATGDYATAETELRAYLADIPNDLRGYALLGAVNFSQNHLRQAESYLEQAVRNNVGGSVTARLLAETRLRLNKPGEALTALGQPGAAGVADPELLAMYGRAQLGLGNTAEALAFFEQGLAAGSDSAATSLSLAAGFFAAGDNQRAIAVLESIPQQQDAKYMRETLLIAAHIREGNSAAALRIGGDLLEANPDDAAAYTLVGVLHQSLGDLKAARNALTTALDLDANDVAASYAMSQLELLEGNYAAAEKLLINVLDQQPGNMPALVALAGIYVRDDRLGQIDARVQAAIDANAEILPPRLLQIRLALLQGNTDAAMAAVKSAKTVFADAPEIAHLEGLVFVQRGQPEEALGSLRRAANSDRENASFQYDYASLSFSSGDLQAAREAIDRYRKMQPENYRGLALLAAIFSRQNNFDAARHAMNEYAAAYPEETSVLVLKGDIELAAGDVGAAAQQYELASRTVWNREVAIRLARALQATDANRAAEPLLRWLDENPDDAEVRRLYGQLLEASGNSSAAVSEYERLLAAGEADAITLNNLAWQYAMEGRTDAVSLAEQAYALAPDNGSIADTYGWILYLNRDYQAALPLLERASKLSPDNAEIRYHVAATHAMLGNKAEARAIITDLLSSGQDFPSRAEAEKLAETL